MSKIDIANPPKFDVPTFDDITVAFGSVEKHYLTRQQLGDWYDMNTPTPYHEAFNGLFYRGGKLADYGLSIKPGLDQTQVMRALRALMSSWAPKHEIKTATVAVALANWCDVAADRKASTPEASAQAQSAGANPKGA